MKQGKVKWFDATKGYGFVQPDDGSADCFVHISAVEASGIGSLVENEMISFELETKNGKTSVCNITKIKSAS